MLSRHSEGRKAFPGYHLEQLPAGLLLLPLPLCSRVWARKESPRRITSEPASSYNAEVCFACTASSAALHHATLAVSCERARNQQCYTSELKLIDQTRWGWVGSLFAAAAEECRLKRAFNRTGQIVGAVWRIRVSLYSGLATASATWHSACCCTAALASRAVELEQFNEEHPSVQLLFS